LSGTNSTIESDEKCLQKLYSENLKERGHLRDIDVHGGRILKCILNV